MMKDKEEIKSVEANVANAMKSDHNVEKNHICDYCNSAFVTKLILEQHIDSIHLQKKDFQCNQCEKCFSLESNLKRHIKYIHDKASIVKCDICGKNLRGTNVHILLKQKAILNSITEEFMKRQENTNVLHVIKHL